MNATTTAIANISRPSALNAMAIRFNVEPAKLLETLKNTAFKGATDSQMMALVIVANEWGLNPFTKEIYAFPDKGGGIVPVVGVDGWLHRLNDHEQLDGVEKEFKEGADGRPFSCTVTIHRKDRKYPTQHTELLSECYRNTDPWNKQPHRMLGHRAVIQCARIAFGFAGADPEEAERVYAPTQPEIRKPLFSAPVVEVSPAIEESPQKEPRKPRAKAPVEPVEASEPVQEVEVPPDGASHLYESPKQENTPNDELAEFVTVECRASFENLCNALVNLQWVKGAQVEVWTSFDDIPLAIVTKCLKSKSGLGARLEDEKALTQQAEA